MKKKGFTLIELLAVIVILAIISVITVPTILGVIEKAKKGGFEQSVKGIIGTAGIYYANNLDSIGENDSIVFICNGKTCEDKNGNKLDFKGSVPTSGQIVLNGKQEVNVLSLKMDGYCASGTSNNLQIAKDCKDIDLTPPELELGSAQTTTKSIIVPILKNEDPDSGIINTTCVYGKDTNYGSKGTIQGSSCVINNLKPNTTYYYKIETENGRNQKVNKTGKATTSSFGNIEITSNSSDWATSKTVTITSSSKEQVEYRVVHKTSDGYEVKQDWTNYSKALTINWMSTPSNPTMVYARLYDGENYSDEATLTITKIDTSAPSASLLARAVNTKTVTLTATCTDNESGISKYEYSKDNGSSWDKGTNGSYTYSGLKTGASYNFKVRCTNGAGTVTTSNAVSGTTTSFAGITITPSSSNWTTSKTVTITGSTADAKLQYRVLNGSIVKQDWTEYTKALTIDWMSTPSNPTVIYARFYDGTNYSDEETFTITKIDTSAPSASLLANAINTKTVTLTATCADNESGISKYEYSKDNGSSWDKGTSGSYTYSGLKTGASYNFKVRCTNGAGTVTTSNSVSGTTTSFTGIKITPSSSNWTTSKTVTITGSTADAKLQYRVLNGSIVKQDWTEYTKALTIDWMSTPSNPTVIYARFYDGTNYSDEETFTITKIDTTAPSLTLGAATKTTKKITIPFSASDSESGIASTSCVYGTSTSYGSTGTVSGNTCVINGDSGKTYYYKITTKNNSGMSTSKTDSTTLGTANISVSLTQTPTGTTYAQSKTLKITYAANNVSKPSYYLKTTIAATSDINAYSCGTSTDPGTCSSTAVTSLAANTWYKVSGNASVTFKANGSLYSRINDGESYVVTDTQTITKIDTTKPTLTLGQITKTTKKITIPFTASDAESGITGTTCEYGTSTSYGSKGTVSGNTCVINGESGKIYYYKVVTTNGSGLTATQTGNTVTGNTGISFNLTQTPTSTTYAQSKVANISFTTNNVTSPTYYIKTTVTSTSDINAYSCGTSTDPGTCSTTAVTSLAANTWYKVAGNTKVTFKTNGTLYARINDGIEYSSAESLTISKIDTTKPSIALGTITRTTKKITIPFTAADNDSGITSTSCVYGTSTSYGSTGTVSGSAPSYSCVINGESGKTYYYKITATNGSGLTETYTSNTVIGSTSVEFGITQTPTGTTYAQNKVVKVTFNSSNVTKPTYYVKTTVATTSSVNAYSCGTSTNPGTCSTTAVTSLAANTWYKVSGTTNITFKANGTVYGLIHDGSEYATSSSQTITKIDTTAPTASLATASATTTSMSLTATCADNESGITKYEFSKDGGTNWTNNGTKAGYTYTGLTTGSKYTFKVRCTNGSGLQTTAAKETTLTKPTITFTEDPSAGSYAMKKAVTVTFNKQVVTNPTYYIKTSVATTINENVYSCGTSTNPGTCSTTAVTSLAANTWYKVSAKPIVTLLDNGTVYALIYDGSSYLTAETRTITTIIKRADQIYYNNSTYTNGTDITVQAAIEDLYKRLSK